MFSLGRWAIREYVQYPRLYIACLQTSRFSKDTSNIFTMFADSIALSCLQAPPPPPTFKVLLRHLKRRVHFSSCELFMIDQKCCQRESRYFSNWLYINTIESLKTSQIEHKSNRSILKVNHLAGI